MCGDLVASGHLESNRDQSRCSGVACHHRHHRALRQNRRCRTPLHVLRARHNWRIGSNSGSSRAHHQDKAEPANTESKRSPNHRSPHSSDDVRGPACDVGHCNSIPGRQDNRLGCSRTDVNIKCCAASEPPLPTVSYRLTRAIWPTRRRCAGIRRVGKKLLENPAPRYQVPADITPCGLAEHIGQLVMTARGPRAAGQPGRNRSSQTAQADSVQIEPARGWSPTVRANGVRSDSGAPRG